MSRKELAATSVAEAYLALLAERGVEYLFANAGTDFAPIVEAYAKAAHTGLPAPKPLIATHENLAMSMAHGAGATRRGDRADLGHEPPIRNEDPTGEAPERSRAPWRWARRIPP